nr:MAG TPA: baseplate protein [Caudoviricetes sp.]
MINDSLILNANSKSVKTLIHAVQGENGSRIFDFTVIGTDGEILNLSDCEANFYVSKNDGTVSMLPTVISENSAQVTLTQQACTVSGDNDCWLQIIKANKTAELRVDNLVLRVQKCNLDGAVESSNEFVTLTQKIVEANEAIKNANQAADDVRKDGAQAIQEINQDFNTAMIGFNKEIDAAVKKAEDAAGAAEGIAEQAAISTINTQKNQPNGIAGLNSNGKLIQMPTAADVGAVPTSRTINGKPLTGNITLTVEDIGTNAIFLASHPVGSLFETTVSTNPGTLYGGTWAAWGGGRVPVGVNTADSDFNTVEKTGGKKTERHEFKIGYKGYYGTAVGSDDNMIQAYKHSTSSYGTYAYEGSTQASVNAGIQASTNTRDVAQASSTGDTSATSIVQPYITCYIWKRTT